MVSELSTMEWDIILFSEARAPTNIVDLDNGCRLYTSFGTNIAAGVGILVNAHLVPHIIGHKCISDRVMCVQFQLGTKKLCCYAVYIPHCGYDIQLYDHTYDQLQTDAIRSINDGYRLIIGGDFNTQIDIALRGQKVFGFAAACAIF